MLGGVQGFTERRDSRGERVGPGACQAAHLEQAGARENSADLESGRKWRQALDVLGEGGHLPGVRDWRDEAGQKGDAEGCARKAEWARGCASCRSLRCIVLCDCVYASAWV